MQTMTKGGELVEGIGRARSIGWGENARPGPRGLAARFSAIDHAHALPIAGKLVGEREADYASADNEKIVHSKSG